nr:class III extradiol ring-cleavage dioxygenase [Nannocystis sp.]
MLRRRDLLGLLPGLGALACGREEIVMPTVTTPRSPVLFVAHGAPPLLDDPAWIAELAQWAHELPRPRAILMISAHWEARPLTLGATRPVPLIYDFHGFPDRFYRLQYAAPGAPALADRVRSLVADAGIPFHASERGLDHGAYIPLMCMYPQAEIPVLQISMPSLDPHDLYALGQALAPLRDEGVLIVGSGFLTHNLRSLRNSPVVPTWASEFDHWIADVLTRRDHDALLDYRRRAPALQLAHPTEEHFAPVLVAAGAAGTDPVRFPITGFWFGSFTRRSVQFG